MIFPGMDPYLEDSTIWQGVHTAMIDYIRDQLQPVLGRDCIAAIGERVYLAGPGREVIPDVWLKRRSHAEGGGGVAVLAGPEVDDPVVIEVPPTEIHEPHVTIIDRRDGRRIVTVIEVVSISNKYAGPGRGSYLTQQRQVLGSPAHLVEIDLLRSGPHVLAVPEWAIRGRRPYDYLVSVNRAEKSRARFELYPRTLRDRLPRVGIPRAGDDPDVALDVQAVLAKVYEAGRYDDRFRYDAACIPALSADDQAWADGLIRSAAPAD